MIGIVLIHNKISVMIFNLCINIYHARYKNESKDNRAMRKQ